MAKFRSVPLPRSEEEFIKAAEPIAELVETAAPEGQGDPLHSAPLVPARELKPARKKAKPAESARPWNELDPNERTSISQTVRLNEYQHEQLKWIAEKEERSLAQVLRRLLGPALEAAAD